MDNSGPSLFVNTASVRTLQFLAPMLAVVHKRSVKRDVADFTPLPKMTVSEMLQKNIFQGVYFINNNRTRHYPVEYHGFV